jgi:hypothetical protein
MKNTVSEQEHNYPKADSASYNNNHCNKESSTMDYICLATKCHNNELFHFKQRRWIEETKHIDCTWYENKR